MIILMLFIWISIRLYRLNYFGGIVGQHICRSGNPQLEPPRRLSLLLYPDSIIVSVVYYVVALRSGSGLLSCFINVLRVYAFVFILETIGT